LVLSQSKDRVLRPSSLNYDVVEVYDSNHPLEILRQVYEVNWLVDLRWAEGMLLYHFDPLFCVA